MLGTAGAYGYRSYSVRLGFGAAAPVIVADRSPNKVVPAAADRTAAGALAGSLSPAQPATNAWCSREEQPVALPRPARQPRRRRAPSRRCGGRHRCRRAPPQPRAPTARRAAARPTEPKRIRTVIIRSDGSDRARGRRPVSRRGLRTARASAPAPARHRRQRGQRRCRSIRRRAPGTGRRLAAAAA